MRIKRILVLTVCIMLFFESFAVFANDGGNSLVKVCSNGEFVSFDENNLPFISENRVMMPVRKICEALNASVVWESETQTVFISKNNTSLAFQAGAKAMFKSENSQSTVIETETAAVIKNNTLTAPVRFIAEALGASVSWDNNQMTVIITYE